MTSTTTRVSIAKALRLRKQLKGQIADLARRAQGCVAVADGKAADFDFAAVNAVYSEKFTAPFPARVTIQVAALPRGSKVEIDAIALIPS